MEKVTVVKVGGAIVEDSEQLAQLLKDFAAIPGKKVFGAWRWSPCHQGSRSPRHREQDGERSPHHRCRHAGSGDHGLWWSWSTKNLVAKLQANGVNALRFDRSRYGCYPQP